MPKKFKGENTKAVEARNRKTAVKQAERDRAEKQREDEYWRDDDKHVAKKTQRKEEKQTKREEELTRKKQLRELADAELQAGASKERDVTAKVTHAQLAAHRDKVEAERRKQEQAELDARKNIVVQEEDAPLPENINRMKISGQEAHTVTEAIDLLNESAPTADKHPEKRMKAAYTAYEERRMPQLRAENPGMRMSQLRQLLHKEWQSAPENPMYQKRVADAARLTSAQNESDEDTD